MQPLLKTHEFDEYGLLLDPEDWNHRLALDLAREEGIDELTQTHWDFINLLRNYYYEFHVPPPASQICHELRLDAFCGHDLFNNILAAWRIAGLPDPGEEAKSYMSAD